MNDEPLTLDRMRADVAALLHEDEGAITDEANLLDYGLDSLRIMELAERWTAASGAPVDFASLAEEPELRAWWKLISDLRG